MGLFDKLTDGTKSELSQEIIDGLDLSHNNGRVQNAAESPDSAAHCPAAYTTAHTSCNTDDEYFDAIITEAEFPGYTIEHAVPPHTLDANAHPKSLPISYLFKKDGTPILAVLIMNRNQYRAMIAVGTYETLDSSDIGYLRFYREMENEKSYVLNRIRESLS